MFLLHCWINRTTVFFNLCESLLRICQIKASAELCLYQSHLIHPRSHGWGFPFFLCIGGLRSMAYGRAHPKPVACRYFHSVTFIVYLKAPSPLQPPITTLPLPPRRPPSYPPSIYRVRCLPSSALYYLYPSAIERTASFVPHPSFVAYGLPARTVRPMPPKH